MEMKRYLLLLLTLISCISFGFAQKLQVESFMLVENDLSAQTQSRKDLNDKNCALVKVQFVGTISEAEGNVVMPLVKRGNETWVYMPQNSRHLKVFSKNYLPVMVTFADFGIEKLGCNRTYVLVLNRNDKFSTQEIANFVKQASPISSNNSTYTSGSTITIPVKDGINIEMVKVEAGTFMMGATLEQENPWDDEKPVHKVSLTKDYYIGKYEVTQALWQAIMEENPSNFKGETLPVNCVSWLDCKKIIEKLNLLVGKNFRLPKEAEWEYAARGGKYSQGYRYSGSDILTEVAWCKENSNSTTHPVGTKKANEINLYDMSGNVIEWCQDDQRTYQNMLETNPCGPLDNTFSHSARGGSWYYAERYCRLSCRYKIISGRVSSSMGLRLVLSE